MNRTQQLNILVIHGPNLNRLGRREPDYYGHETLESINEKLQRQAQEENVLLAHFQSNHEGALIDKIHEAGDQKLDFLIINPAGLSHTSIALRDAILAIAVPFIEVHLSNIHQREAFRHHSFFSDIAQGVICGLGSLGYELALQAAILKLKQKQYALKD